MEELNEGLEVATIRSYLKQVAGPKLTGMELSLDTDLLGSGILDSLGVLQLTTFLSETLGIEVIDDDFVPENFQTIGSLVRFIAAKRSTAIAQA